MSSAIEQPEVNLSRASSVSGSAAAAIVAAAALIASVHFVWLVSDHSRVWVHPSFYVDILRQSVVNGLEFDWRDFLSVFMQRVDNEVRARFLNYLIMAWDQKLRLAMYAYGPVHPSLMPISGFLYVIAAPALLFHAVSMMTRDRRAALATVAVYLSSIGFLSCFAMNFMPAKPLSTVGYVITIWLAARIDRSAPPGQLLMDTVGRTKWALCALLLMGFYIDELMFFAWCLPPVLFPDRFLPKMSRRPGWRHVLQHAARYALPVGLFALSVLTVIPYITRTYFGWDFTYFGFNANLSNQVAYGGEYPADLEPGLSFISDALVGNLRNLFEISLLSWPYTVAWLAGRPGTGLYSLGTVPPLLTFAALGGFLALQSALLQGASWRTSWLARVWIATVVYVAFLTVLQLKHVPIVIGYNYGAGFAVFFSLLLGGTVALMFQRGWQWRVGAALLTLYIVLVQISNFHPLNENWDRVHRTFTTGGRDGRIEPGRPPFPRHPVNLSIARDASAEERRAIWQAWKDGRLPEYLRQHDVPVNLLALVYELAEIDQLRPR
jgi:hypothetical protein